MSGKRLWIKSAVCTVALLTLAVQGPEAVPVAPGQTLGAEGIAFLGGTELDSLCYGNLVSGNLVVDIASSVVQSVGGTLDFYYQVRNDSNLNQLHRLTASDFSGFLHRRVVRPRRRDGPLHGLPGRVLGERNTGPPHVRSGRVRRSGGLQFSDTRFHGGPGRSQPRSARPHQRNSL